MFSIIEYIYISKKPVDGLFISRHWTTGKGYPRFVRFCKMRGKMVYFQSLD